MSKKIKKQIDIEENILSKDEIRLNEISLALKENMRKLDELLKKYNYPMPPIVEDKEDEDF